MPITARTNGTPNTKVILKSSTHNVVTRIATMRTPPSIVPTGKNGIVNERVRPSLAIRLRKNQCVTKISSHVAIAPNIDSEIIKVNACSGKST